MRATICSRTVTASVQPATADSAAAKSCRCPASRNARTAAVPSEPATVSAARCRPAGARPGALAVGGTACPRAQRALGLLAIGADAHDVPGQAATLERTDQPGTRIELPAAEAVPGGRREGVMVVVPRLPEGDR